MAFQVMFIRAVTTNSSKNERGREREREKSVCERERVTVERERVKHLPILFLTVGHHRFNGGHFDVIVP